MGSHIVYKHFLLQITLKTLLTDISFKIHVKTPISTCDTV